MADQDFALLVGISRYKDGNQFPPLDGPLHDVARVRAWLADTVHGQSVPDANIRTLTTAAGLLADPPAQGWPPSTDWSPNWPAFSALFTGIAFDDMGRPVRRPGRLYLYFSGHGFSLSEDDSAGAALFSADCVGWIQSNLAGTTYAAAAKRAKLFAEIVLVMDCCRDVVQNQAYNLPNFLNVESSGSDSVRLYAMYAAPRGGKSQERVLPGAGPDKVGVMTDGLLRALKEAPCDVTGQVAGTTLKQILAFNWTTWYPFDQMPPPPRVLTPDEGDVYFRSTREDLVQVTFSSSTPLVDGDQVSLQGKSWTATAIVANATLAWRDDRATWSQNVPLAQAPDGRQQFTLVLPPGAHSLVVRGQTRTFDPGVGNAIQY